MSNLEMYAWGVVLLAVVALAVRIYLDTRATARLERKVAREAKRAHRALRAEKFKSRPENGLRVVRYKDRPKKGIGY